jgi:CelD/BcsL family acetyltransferase involved in cellulose biosynthesis
MTPDHATGSETIDTSKPTARLWRPRSKSLVGEKGRTARIELVTTVDRLIELEQAWQVLWQKKQARIFQSHPWLAAWARHKDPHYALRVGLIWEQDGTLAAILPMAIRKFLGVGILEWAGQSVCDYCDGVGSPADLRSLWNSMRKMPGADVVRLKNIAPDANVAVLFDAELTPSDVCLKVASNSISGDVWFRSLNKKKRNNFNRGQRLLEEIGSTSMICHETVPDETLVTRLLELKKSWLKASNRESSFLFDDDHPDRLRSLVQALEQLGRLRLFVITCGDAIVSASVNFVEGRSLCAIFSAYNAEFDRVSPGIMLMTAYTRWAFNNGFTEIDYLQGGEVYKFEFANSETTLSSVVLPSSVLGHIALAAYRGQRWIGKFRGKTGRLLRTGGAYMTKAGNLRKIAAPDQRENSS